MFVFSDPTVFYRFEPVVIEVLIYIDLAETAAQQIHQCHSGCSASGAGV